MYGFFQGPSRPSCSRVNKKNWDLASRAGGLLWADLTTAHTTLTPPPGCPRQPSAVSPFYSATPGEDSTFDMRATHAPTFRTAASVFILYGWILICFFVFRFRENSKLAPCGGGCAKISQIGKITRQGLKLVNGDD